MHGEKAKGEQGGFRSIIPKLPCSHHIILRKAFCKSSDKP